MNLKTTLTLVVILAILLAAYFLLPKDQKATLRETGKMVSGYETDRISRIRIENAENNEKIVVTKSGDDWQWTSRCACRPTECPRNSSPTILLTIRARGSERWETPP